MISTRLIIVRHGETIWNEEGKLQGQADSALNSRGIAQSQALAGRLARCSFAALYSSDLGRARHSAELIAAATGHPILTDVRLRERHLGIFQGLTWPEVEQAYPGEYERFVTGEVDYVVPEGESFNQSSVRMMECLDELARRHAGQDIAIVSHGGVLGAVLRHVLGIVLEARHRFKRFNGSWNVFIYDNGAWLLETWGDISHLQQTQSLKGEE